MAQRLPNTKKSKSLATSSCKLLRLYGAPPRFAFAARGLSPYPGGHATTFGIGKSAGTATLAAESLRWQLARLVARNRMLDAGRAICSAGLRAKRAYRRVRGTRREWSHVM